MSRALATALLLLFPLFADARDSAMRAQFMREIPCPSTGFTRGACPGYQVDHVSALCAGGADEPRNMQWLSVADHALKTKLDVYVCAAMRRAAR